MEPGLYIFRKPGVSVLNKACYPVVLRDIAKAIEQGHLSGDISLRNCNGVFNFGSWEILKDSDDIDAIAESNPEDHGAPAPVHPVVGQTLPFPEYLKGG